MKKLLCLILCFALTGCQTQTKQPTSETESTTQILQDEWTPYDGDAKNYVYYYDSGLNRLWEEDLLYVANTYLEKHALLTSEESRVSFRDGVVWDGYYTDEMYDPEIREEFLAVFNEIVPKLGEMTKTQFLFSVQKMLAVLRDAHAYLMLPYEKVFPCSVIQDDDGLYVVCIDEKYEELLYSQLISINGMPVDEVIDAMRPYVPYENDYWLMAYLTEPYYIEALFSLEMLQMADIVKDGNQAEFEFRKDDGSCQTIELTAVDYSYRGFDQHIDKYHYDSPLFENLSEKFWYKFIGDTPYFRISSFDYDEEDAYKDSLLEVTNALFAEVREKGGAQKLILDLRGNGGGYKLLGYHQVVTVLQRLQIDTIYVLIDAHSFSQSIVFASYIKQEVENAILVGTPAGQAPNFFGAVEEYTMPNTKTTFVLGWQWWQGWEDYEYEALMPDIIVEQTLEDYKNGVDAVLNYILK